MTLPRILPALLTLMLASSGCRKPAVESYRVPKETVAQSTESTSAPNDATHAGINKGSSRPSDAGPTTGAPSGGAMANTAVTTSSGGGLSWTVPKHWTAKPASAMRKGTYILKADGVAGEAELAITAFPGNVGGDLANVNRWRGQVNLPAVSAADFAASAQKLEHNGLKMTVVSLTGAGEKPQDLLGAMIPHDGSTWFVKLTGPPAILAREKAAFMSFLETIKPAASAK